MDQSNDLQPSVKEGNEKCDSRTSASIVLTATLAIAGIGAPALLPEGTTAERIEAIQKAFKSGAIELQPISSSEEAPPKGRMMAHT